VDQFPNELLTEGDLLGWFAHEGIATSHSKGEKPKGHHGRKVERGNAGEHTHGLAHGLAVNATSDVLERLPHEKSGRTGGDLNHLDSALDTTQGFRKRFSVFAGDDRGQLLGVLVHECL